MTGKAEDKTNSPNQEKTCFPTDVGQSNLLSQTIHYYPSDFSKSFQAPASRPLYSPEIEKSIHERRFTNEELREKTCYNNFAAIFGLDIEYPIFEDYESFMVWESAFWEEYYRYY
ncbi:MAG: hypothetical protein SFT91_02640 [Rickettsiaceae bacterium]|nr:hypothetical protein [Rickettsiaceae bacterium]